MKPVHLYGSPPAQSSYLMTDGAFPGEGPGSEMTGSTTGNPAVSLYPIMQFTL